MDCSWRCLQRFDRIDVVLDQNITVATLPI